MRKSNPKRPKSAFKTAPAIRHNVEARKHLPEQPPRPVAARKLAAIVAVNPVRFLDRRMHHECCAILNDGVPIEALMVCGGPIEPESAFEFCAAHAARFLTANARRPALAR